MLGTAGPSVLLFFALSVLSFLAPTPTTAQWRTDRRTGVAAVAEPVARPVLEAAITVQAQATSSLAAGGLVGAFLGAGGGFALGAILTNSAAGGIVGAAVGESLGLVTGVHLANGRRDPWGDGALHALAIGALAAILIVQSGSDAALLGGGIAVPLVQLPIVIAVKRGYGEGG